MAINEGNRLHDVIAFEMDRHHSRKSIVIASGQTVVMGQVLGVVSASGEYAAFDQDASDGTEAAAGIAFADYDASSGAIDGVAFVRDVQYVDGALTWPGTITAGEQAAAEAQLEAVGITKRVEV